MRIRALAAALAALAAVPAPVTSQDVELLGERYGTRPPDGYFRTLGGDPGAFRFERGRTPRLRQAVLRAAAGGEVQPGLAAVFGPRNDPVLGEYTIPVVLGLFSDSPAGTIPFPRETVADAYFGAHGGSITAFYQEISGGRVTLHGTVGDWVRSNVSQLAATGEESGLIPGTVGPFIRDLLQQLTGVDWGPYDNDGPDGVPNSGDDDGFVDALAVIHPTHGAECGGTGKDDRIWSHKWTLRSASGATFRTTTPAAGGGFIRVDDYFIQPVYACGGGTLNEIGVFAHEAGHAFGLPDLYDTYDSDGKAAGAGNWDLMATGSWGCDGRSPASPCHMGAWSKAMLGWVDVVAVPGDADAGTLRLAPVETGGTVLRADAGDGSGEYFLLENRQRRGFDGNLAGEGLLVWQVSPALLASLWPANRVNAHARMAVWLRQADGRDDLGRSGGGRGDAGDVFPYAGSAGENRVFHAASNPSSVSERATPTGLTLLDIQRVGPDVTLRVLTRFTRVTVRSEGAGAEGLFTVNGTAVAEAPHTFRSAPFVKHTVEASAGESLGTGVRRPFLGWDDLADAPRVRALETPLEDVSLVARYGGRQVELAIEARGGVNDVAPGTFSSAPAAPDLWFAEGTTVSVTAVPTRGFAFTGWTGALAGQANPATVTMAGPASAGADFALTYAVASSTVQIVAAEEQNLTLEPENGTAPYVWTVLEGSVPQGLDLDVLGILRGAALETGTFPLRVRVRDSLGLTAEGTVTLAVAEPAFTVGQLAAPFLLTGPEMTLLQLRFVDRQGNRDGVYDLGDFRAWILAHPQLPLSAAVRALVAAPPGGGGAP